MDVYYPTFNARTVFAWSYYMAEKSWPSNFVARLYSRQTLICFPGDPAHSRRLDSYIFFYFNSPKTLWTSLSSFICPIKYRANVQTCNCFPKNVVAVVVLYMKCPWRWDAERSNNRNRTCIAENMETERFNLKRANICTFLSFDLHSKYNKYTMREREYCIRLRYSLCAIFCTFLLSVWQRRTSGPNLPQG